LRTVGVRELKAHISEILRRVQEDGEIIEVTNHGEVVARVVPVRAAGSTGKQNGTAWTDIDLLAAEIGKRLPDPVDAVKAVSDIRREL
jgi:prevent-host-death family protein